MISLDTIHEITNQVKSRVMSALQTLSNQAAALRQKWGELTPKVALLSNFAQFKTGKINDIEIMDQESFDLACKYADDGQELAFNTSADDVMTVSFYNGASNNVLAYVNGIAAFNIDKSDMTIEYVDDLDGGQLNTIDKIVQNNSKTAGMYYALADIADMASQSDWTANTNLSSGLYAKINQYRNILGSFIGDLITSVTRGPASLLQCITGLISNVQKQLEKQDLSSLMNSTNIVLNHFSWGLIAQTIGSVVTAVGTVVMAVSRIAGAIIMAAGLIANIVGRIVVSAGTAFDDTQYKVRAGADVMHAFSFVVDQGEDDLPGVASYMRERGWETMTVVCPFQGSVFFMYLEEFDSDTNNTIHFEQHLSSDIDLSDLMLEMRLGSDGAAWYPFIKVPNYYQSGTKACGISCMPQYNATIDSRTYTNLHFCIMNAYGVDTTTKPSYCLREYYDPEDFLKPSDFSILDTLKQWYDSSLTNFFDIRLCSAIIMWCAYRLGMGGFWSGWNHFPSRLSIGDLMGYRISPSTQSEINNIATYLDNLYFLAWRCFIYNKPVSSTDHRLKSEFGLENSERENLLNAIQSVFNVLEYKKHVPETTIPAQVISITKSAETGTEHIEAMGYSDYSLTPERCQDIANSTIGTMFRIGYADEEFRSGQWINSFAVDLPTLTFSGFIAGLIIDGLLLAVTAAITVVAVVGWVKLRNKASQLQAKAEAAWYNYEDDQSEKNWKEYKRARFKYNVLAVCTGGTTLGLGLYDDGSSADTVAAVKGYADDGGEQTSINSLTDIIKILKG